MGNIKRLLFIQFSLDFISGAFLVLSSWTVFASTGSALLTGLYVSLGFLPSLISNIYIVAIVDRWDAKKMLQISYGVMLLAIVCIGFSFFYEVIVLLFVGQMLVQLAGSIFRPSVQVYMTHLYEPEKLTYIFTKSASLTILGGVVGTFIASQFLSFSAFYVLVLMLLFIVITIIISMKLPQSAPKHIAKKSTIHQDIIEGFHYAKSKRLFVKLFILLGSGQVITHCTIGFLAAFTYETFTNNAAIYGYLQISLTVGGVLLGFLTKKLLAKCEQYFAKGAFLVLCISLFLCAISTHIIVIGASIFVVGLLTTWIRSHYQAIQQINTDRQFNGKMASFRMIINQSSVVIISPVLGVVGSTFGINSIYALLGVIALTAYFTTLKLKMN